MTLDPTRLHAITCHDFRDALDALSGDVPPDPDGYTPSAIAALLRDLSVCEGYLLMLQRIAEQRDRCAARQGYEYAWERA